MEKLKSWPVRFVITVTFLAISIGVLIIPAYAENDRNKHNTSVVMSPQVSQASSAMTGQATSYLSGTMQYFNTSNSGLCSDSFAWVAIDKQQTVWFTAGGLGPQLVCQLDSSGQWHTITAPAQAKEFPDAHGVWQASSEVLYRDYDGTVVTYTASNSPIPSEGVWHIFIDTNNNAWFTSRTVEMRSPDGQWTTYTSGNSGLVANNANWTMVDHLGRVWISTQGQGVSMRDTDGTWTTYTNANTNGGLINDIAGIDVEDQAGNIWFGMYGGAGGGGGVSKLSPSGVWTTYRTSNSPLISEIVNVVDIDSAQNLWIGTRDGVSVLSPDGTWTTFSDVGCVQKFAFAANGDVWMASYFGGGVHLFHPDHPLTTASTLTSVAPTAIAAGTPGVTLTVQGANFTPRSMILLDGSPRPTQYISPSLMVGSLPAGDFTSTRSLSITVYDLSFSTTSNALTLAVRTRKDLVATGYGHTCALTPVGGVKCWGGSANGQVGDGTPVDRYTPVDVVGMSSGIQGIAAGYSHACALTSVGGAKCWGQNGHGQIGNGMNIDSFSPVDVIGLTSGVLDIAAGELHTCALTIIGGVKCWGDNTYGELGDGTTIDRHTPVDVTGLSSGVLAISVGFAHTCALTGAGGVKCWGWNGNGQVGDGTTSDRSTPVEVVGLSNSMQAVSAGWDHTCSLTSVGGIKCWGGNAYGQLGDGTMTDRYIPVDMTGIGSGLQMIAAGVEHTCVLTSIGGVECWGINTYGELGDGTTTNRLMPVNVIGLSSGVRTIATNVFHTCVVTVYGGVKCWGWNHNGQLGDGTNSDRYTPIDVQGLQAPVISPITVVINGPTAGLVNLPYTFTASVDLTTTTPVTYIWQWTNQDVMTHTGEFSDSVSLIWPVNGLQTISVTVVNAGGSAGTSVLMNITSPVASSWHIYNTSNSPLPSNCVHAGAIDRDGAKWFGTCGGGVARFDGTTWTIYNTSNSGLPSNDVRSMAIDRSGNKWFGTLGGGAARFDGTTWTIYQTSNSGIPDNNIWGIAFDGDGAIWFSTQTGGVAHLKDANWTVFNTSNSPLPNNFARSVAVDHDRVKWFGTYGGGVVRYDGVTWAIYNTTNSGIAFDSVASINVDYTGSKWFGSEYYSTGGGVSRFDGAAWTVYKTTNSGLPDSIILPVAFDAAGRIWFGTANGGVAVLNGTAWTIYNTSNSGLPSNTVLTILLEPDGTKWFGASSGVAVLRNADYSISGSVNDAVNNPIPDVIISLTTNTGVKCDFVTSTSGFYTIGSLITGTYTITPTKYGYSFSPPTRTITVTSDIGGQDFTGRLPINLSLTPPAHIDAGSTVLVPVWVNNTLTSDGLGGVQIRLEIGNTAIVVPDIGAAVAPGTLIPPDSYTYTAALPNGYDYMAVESFSAQPITGSGVLVYLPVRGVSEGCTTLTFSEHILGDSNGLSVAHTTTDAVICVLGKVNLTGAAYLQSRASGHYTGTQVVLTGSRGVYTTTTDATGAYALTGIYSDTYTVRLTHGLFVGAMRTVTATQQATTAADIGLWAGDVRGDGVVDQVGWYLCAAASIPVSDPAFDIKDDGATNVLDCIVLAGNIGRANMATTNPPRTGLLMAVQAEMNTPAAPSQAGSLYVASLGNGDYSIRLRGTNVKMNALGLRLKLATGSSASSVELRNSFAGGYAKWHQDGDRLYLVASPQGNGANLGDTEVALVHTDGGGAPVIEAQNSLGVAATKSVYLPLTLR